MMIGKRELRPNQPPAPLSSAFRTLRFKPVSTSPSLLTLLPLLVTILLCLARSAVAYKAPISDTDELRQICSGMWGDGVKSKINVTFDPGAAGALSLVIYEWNDLPLLGVDSPGTESMGYPVKTYVCTSSAVQSGLCSSADLGKFIVNDPNGSSSIRTEEITFPSQQGAAMPEYSYGVNMTGYYCVVTVPVTVDKTTSTDPTINDHGHAKFDGFVTFVNVFDGTLPAAEYPKVGFYFALTSIYIIIAFAWMYLCIKHKDELLPIQHYVSGTLLVIITEMAATWGYYSYLNQRDVFFGRTVYISGSTSVTAMARFLLVLVAVLNAARNSMSLFLLCIVSMGYGVVRPSLGKLMNRVRILTVVHFLFNMAYSIGTVAIVLEEAGPWIFLFVFPLAFTLTTFLMWTMYSLNATIEHLNARKQTFKKQMFTKLYRVLVCATVVIAAFFVISSVVFSRRTAEDFASNSWKYRWFLLDGWLGCLYLFVFLAIAWLWRPTGSNRRFAMSDELATDEDGAGAAGEFEIDTLAHQMGDGLDSEDEDNEDVERRGARSQQEQRAGSRQARGNLQDDEVVFEIGEEEDDPESGSPRTPRPSGPARDRSEAREGEAEGLMSHQEGSEETLVKPQAGQKKSRTD